MQRTSFFILHEEVEVRAAVGIRANLFMRVCTYVAIFVTLCQKTIFRQYCTRRLGISGADSSLLASGLGWLNSGSTGAPVSFVLAGSTIVPIRVDQQAKFNCTLNCQSAGRSRSKVHPMVPVWVSFVVNLVPIQSEGFLGIQKLSKRVA